ncbi:MAG: alkaline shock response membrane anchor protein AmaP [bacterium]|jgi:uncharacterized alkaline shock family protein YloU|nr:alkaline shock response membrane anchor protein AmaP [bacterium]
MKKLSLYLSFLFLFGFSILCWLIVLGDMQDPMIIAQSLSWLFQGFQGKLLIAACGLLTLGCSFSILLISLHVDIEPRNLIIQENDTGAIGISFDAIDQFILRMAKDTPGVQSVTVRTEERDEDLFIKIRLTLNLDLNVPAFTREFQDTLYRELDDKLGLTHINEIQILVDNVSTQEPISPYAKEGKSQIVLKDTPPDEPESPPTDLANFPEPEVSFASKAEEKDGPGS